MQTNSASAFEYLYEIDNQLTHEHVGKNIAGQSAQQSLHFRVAEYNLLIKLNTSTEVINAIDCSLIPRTQSWLLGMASLRGQLLPLIDLNSYWFNAAPAHKLIGKRVISTRVGSTLIGLVVDQVFGVVNVIDMELKNMVEKNWDEAVMQVVTSVYSSNEINYGMCDFKKLMAEDKFGSMQRMI